MKNYLQEPRLFKPQPSNSFFKSFSVLVFFFRSEVI